VRAQKAAQEAAQETVKTRGATALGWLGELITGEAMRETPDGGAACKPGQAQACARVNAQAKGQVLVVFAFQVQCVGAVEQRSIAAGRAPAQRDQRDQRAPRPSCVPTCVARVAQLKVGGSGSGAFRSQGGRDG
jgi:hypothetical protein